MADKWICLTCGTINGLRTMEGVCKQPAKESECNGRVLYKEIKLADVHDIKKEKGK